MIGLVKVEPIIAFTIGCRPLSSFITHKLELKIPTLESSERIIELSSCCFFPAFVCLFFLVFFYTLLEYFDEQYILKCNYISDEWEGYFHDSSP